MKKKIWVVGIFMLIFDIITKLLIDKNFAVAETKPIIINFFSITKVYNDGASWNLLAGHRIILIIITLIVLAILIYYQSKFQENKRNILAFGFLYGGIMGNLIDRAIYGYVIDFFDFTIFGYNFPVFNVADIGIVLGVFLLIIAIYKKEDNDEVNSR